MEFYEESERRQKYFRVKLSQAKRSLYWLQGDRDRTHQVFIVELGKAPIDVPAIDLYDRQIVDLKNEIRRLTEVIDEEHSFQLEQIDNGYNPQ